MNTAPAHPVLVAPPSLGEWAESSVGVPFAHERCSGVEGPEILITALVHGNEYCGAIALAAYLRTGLLPRRGRITAVFCNVQAFATFDPLRPDASRFVDEDFNRVWSADRLDGNERSAELTRAREIRPLVDRATHLLDLHSMHEPGDPLLVTGLLQRNVEFAQALRTSSHVVADEGHADGVRMRDYGRFADAGGSGIALLLEAGQHWEPASVTVARNTLMRFIVAAGAMDASDVPEGWVTADAQRAPAVRVTHRVVAQTPEFKFTQDFRSGDVVAHAGTVIAHDNGQPILTPYDNCVMVMPSLRQLRPGVTVTRLGRQCRA